MSTSARTIDHTGAYGAPWLSADQMNLVLAPPMSRQTVLRVMVLGFGLAVLLVIGAAYIGYQASESIQRNAQDLIREHLLNSERGAALEARIERQSQELLGELIWILGACFVLALGGAALTIWTTDRAFRRLEWQAAELSRVSWHLVDSHEQIARRFSHEMHDELGQSLAGAKGIVRRLKPADLEAERDQLILLLDEVIVGVRELSQLLRPVILDDFGLDAGLRWLTDRFAQRTQIEVIYESDFNGRLAEGIETQFFRITQEALTNIARHSEATRAWVRLHVNGSRVCLEIRDNGHGIENLRPARPSLGMVGMRARARQVEGELEVGSSEGGGLRIQVSAPRKGHEDGGEQEDSNSIGG